MLNMSRNVLILMGVLALSACKSAEEKAEEFYQSGLSLLEQGDADRAIVEFQNVFQNDGFHKEARRALADVLLERGRTQAAYGQYLRLIEQYPDTPDVRLILAEAALENGDWDGARRHGDAAIALAPADPGSQAIAAAFAYRDAIEADDSATRQAAAATARTLLAADATDDVSRRVVIDDLLRSDTPQDALAEIDRALELDPENYAYNSLRLSLLTQSDDIAAAGAQLQRMVALYPEDADLAELLITWYLTQNDVAGAEDFLRQQAGDDTAAPDGHITVVQLIQATQGPQAAQAELDRLASVNADTPNADLYNALSAVISFEAGSRDSAIATIEGILAGAESTEQTRRIRNILARLLIVTGNQVGARAEVETILSEDPSSVDALKLRATWAIEDDRTSDAIIDLRTALGQEPRDAEILTLMAQAHDRDGATALVGERLAQAVTVSGAAVDESLRYAAFLQDEGRTAAAKTVLSDARSTNAGDVDVLTALASILLAEGSWTQAQDVADTLRGIDLPRAQAAATSLQAALLLGQDRVADSLAFLQDEIAQGDTDVSAIVQVVQIQLQSGDTAAARASLDAALADNPDDYTLSMLSAAVFAIAGDLDAAETQYRAVMDTAPTAEEPVVRLYNLLRAADRPDEVRTLIDDALAAQPQSLNLRWIRASELEAAGDIDGAIAIYEEMYALNSGSVTIVNNLASLLATHRTDAESLERATYIARRLRDADAPPLQDTYGWIAYRNGDYDVARDYLEPAAEGLSDDPLVQYHLGMTYAALDLKDAAREILTRALDLAGDSTLPQFDRARETLQELGE